MLNLALEVKRSLGFHLCERHYLTHWLKSADLMPCPHYLVRCKIRRILVKLPYCPNTWRNSNPVSTRPRRSKRQGKLLLWLPRAVCRPKTLLHCSSFSLRPETPVQ